MVSAKCVTKCLNVEEKRDGVDYLQVDCYSIFSDLVMYYILKRLLTIDEPPMQPWDQTTVLGVRQSGSSQIQDTKDNRKYHGRCVFMSEHHLNG